LLTTPAKARKAITGLSERPFARLAPAESLLTLIANVPQMMQQMSVAQMGDTKTSTGGERDMLPGLPFANIAHLGWAVRDIDATVKNFENLGLGPWRRYILGEADGGHDFLRRDYEGGLDNRAKIALSKWGPIAIELFEPIYFPILEKFLETHGEGIWHFGYSVSRKQFDATIAELKTKGIEVTGQSEYKNGVRMAFLDPRKTGGVVFQLHDCPPHMEDFFDTMGMVVG
jgi:glyoxalase/bleomycin resistance protein/dioxygenase superfamily protein